MRKRKWVILGIVCVVLIAGYKAMSAYTSQLTGDMTGKKLTLMIDGKAVSNSTYKDDFDTSIEWRGEYDGKSHNVSVSIGNLELDKDYCFDEKKSDKQVVKNTGKYVYYIRGKGKYKETFPIAYVTAYILPGKFEIKDMTYDGNSASISWKKAKSDKDVFYDVSVLKVDGTKETECFKEEKVKSNYIKKQMDLSKGTYEVKIKAYSIGGRFKQTQAVARKFEI